MNSNHKLTVWGRGTTRSIRVLWTMLELGLDYEHRPIGSRTGETLTEQYTRLNPKQKIPTLQHGSLVLTESAAIIRYLTRVFPPPAEFFVPEDPAQAAKLDEWCFFIMAELDAHSLYLMRRHRGLPHIYGAAPEAVASAQEYFLKQANAVCPAIDNAGTYLMGERISVADILLMTCVDWALMYEIPLPRSLLDYGQRIAERSKYRQALKINYPAWFSEGGSVPEALRQNIPALRDLA